MKYWESFSYIYELHWKFTPEILYLRGYMERARTVHRTGTRMLYLYLQHKKMSRTEQSPGCLQVRVMLLFLFKSMMYLTWFQWRWQLLGDDPGTMVRVTAQINIFTITVPPLLPPWVLLFKQEAWSSSQYGLVKLSCLVIIFTFVCHLLLICERATTSNTQAEQHASIYRIKGKMCLRQTLEIQHNLANLKDSCFSNGLWRRPW